jgi:hypothetical protein
LETSERTEVERKSKKTRSRITNGSALLPDIDGRSAYARLMRDVYSALTVHCGGTDVMSETKRLAVRRISTIEVELVFLENKFADVRANGGEPDANQLDLYGRLADRQRRLSEPLGWERTARDLTPRFADYVAGRASAAAGEAP